MTKSHIYLLSFLLLGALVVLPATNAQAYDKEMYKKINKELSCQCGCGLLAWECRMPGCMSEDVRRQVGEFLDQGKTEKQIKQAMVGIYGEQILAAPPKSGFNLSAYILPFFFLLAGGSVLYSIVSKWVPKDPGDKNTAAPVSDTAEEEEPVRYRTRIEQELKELDI